MSDALLFFSFASVKNFSASSRHSVKLIRIAVFFGDQNNIIGAFFWHVLVPLRANELVLGGYARALVKFVMVRNSTTMLRTSADPVERPVELHSAMA